ncbi:MAG: helix-turn-helix transcriptional regulator [Acholeplasma sp.]|jgi:transcriptional regulator with XRE-family HTH domain|nr:helix-turn-helix transcriptional regulator [Acholeplasma sp.]
MSKIGNLIQQLRIKKGLTQAQLAEELGITDKAVGKWEQGQGDPDLSLIKPISKFFGISTDELLNGALDEFSSDINKSIYEKVVLSGLDKLPKFIEQGIDLFGTDEYNKSLIDYIYEHQSNEFLEYAMKNDWFEKLEVQFTVTTKRDSYYGTKYDNKNCIFYFQKRLTNKVKQTLRGINSSDKKLVYRLQNSVEHYYTVKTNAFDSLEYDTINILSILVLNEKQGLLESYLNYKYFKKEGTDDKVLKLYSKKKVYDDVFLEFVLQMFRFDVLLNLAIQSNNKLLIDLLAKKFDSNVHGVSTEYLDELIKLNHSEINNKVLLHDNYLNRIDVALVYQFNKFVYDRLPIEIKQKNAHSLAELVTDESEEEVVLHLDIQELISTNKTSILTKHLELVDKAVKQVDEFIDELITTKGNNSEYQFDKVLISKFNNLFKKYFIFTTFDHWRYFNNEGKLTDLQKIELAKINEQRINHVWLQENLNKISREYKKSIYKYIQYTFNHSFEFQLSKIADEAILILIPYLGEFTKHQVLNNYNKDNQNVIKQLLEHGAKFYKDYHGDDSKDIKFDHSIIEFRTSREIERDSLSEAIKFDMMKTLQFKMLLGVK